VKTTKNKIRNQHFIDKRKALIKDSKDIIRMEPSKKNQIVKLVVVSISIPLLTVVLSYLSLEAMKESSEKSMKIAIDSHKEIMAQTNRSMTLAIDTHNKSMEQASNSMTVAVETHKENMIQATLFHEQVLEENYKNLVHEQNRSRYYETILLISNSIRILEGELNFCNDFYGDIQQVYSEKESIYNDAFFFFGENYISDFFNKNQNLDKNTAINLATSELERKYEMLRTNKLMFIEPSIIEHVKNSEDFLSHIDQRKKEIKLYEYIDEKGELYSFILMKLDELHQIANLKDPSTGITINETKLKLEKAYSDIQSKSRVFEQIYVNYKQLGESFSIVADLFLYSEFNNYIKEHGVGSALEYFTNYEDSQVAHYKSTFPTFRSDSEFFLYHYYDVILWNLLVAEATFDYMREVNYEQHVSSNKVIADIFIRIEEKLKLKRADNHFFIYRCESAYQKAQYNIQRTLPHIRTIVESNNIDNEKLLLNMFESVGHYLPKDFSEINSKIADYGLIGPDSSGARSDLERTLRKGSTLH
jgi:hypothetical protein